MKQKEEEEIQNRTENDDGDFFDGDEALFLYSIPFPTYFEKQWRELTNTIQLEFRGRWKNAREKRKSRGRLKLRSKKHT